MQRVTRRGKQTDESKKENERFPGKAGKEIENGIGRGSRQPCMRYYGPCDYYLRMKIMNRLDHITGDTPYVLKYNEYKRKMNDLCM